MSKTDAAFVVALAVGLAGMGLQFGAPLAMMVGGGIGAGLAWLAERGAK